MEILNVRLLSHDEPMRLVIGRLLGKFSRMHGQTEAALAVLRRQIPPLRRGRRYQHTPTILRPLFL